MTSSTSSELEDTGSSRSRDHARMSLEHTSNARARRRRGIVLPADLSDSPARAASRHNLVHLHHGAYVAATQPLTVEVLLASVRETTRGRRVAVMTEGALWLHGVSSAPTTLELGVPVGGSFRVRPPLTTRRVSDSVLDGSRTLKGVQVVALEVAVIQVAANRPKADVRELIEDAVRGRHTTLARLRARCRRGFKGSARVRGICDELAGGSMDADVRRLKAALETRGVTGLEVEVRFTSDDGTSAYADLFHRATSTAFEVDGLVEHSRRARFRADRRRDRWMVGQRHVVTMRIDVLEAREDLDALADELAAYLLGGRLPRSA